MGRHRDREREEKRAAWYRQHVEPSAAGTRRPMIRIIQLVPAPPGCRLYIVENGTKGEFGWRELEVVAFGIDPAGAVIPLTLASITGQKMGLHQQYQRSALRIGDGPLFDGGRIHATVEDWWQTI